MTQPVQEPGTQRSIATGTWNTNQLYRRPAPRTSGGIPWVRLKQLDVSQTWTTNDEQWIIFDDVCYSDDPDGTDFFVVSDKGAGDNSAVTPQVGGIYQLTFFADFNNEPDTGCELLFNRLQWNGNNRQYSIWIAGSDDTPAADGIPINSSSTGFGEVVVRTDAPLNALGDPLEWFVSMNTYASTMSLAHASVGDTYWEIRYLGAATVPLGLDYTFECSHT